MRIETLELLAYLSNKGSAPLLICGRDRVPAFTECLPGEKEIFLSCLDREKRLRQPQGAKISCEVPWQSEEFWSTPSSVPLTTLADGSAVFQCGFYEIPKSAFKRLSALGCNEVLFLQRGDWKRLQIRGAWQAIDLFREKIFNFLRAFGRKIEQCRVLLQKAFLKLFSKNLHSEGVTEFVYDSGHMFKAFVPHLAPFSDKFSNHKSRLFLFEERTLLIPHQSHQSIRTVGRGRFAHWENDIYFSSTDNKDPNQNQRRYRYVLCTGPALFLAPLVTLFFPRGGAQLDESEVSRSEALAPVPSNVIPLHAQLNHTSTKKSYGWSLLSPGRRLPGIPTSPSFAKRLDTLLPLSTPRGMETMLGGSTDEVSMIIGTLGPGGSERQLSYVTRGLRQQQFSVRVYTGNASTPDLLHYLPAIQGSGAVHELYTTPHAGFTFQKLINPQGLSDLTLMESMPPTFAREVWSLYTHLMVNRPKVLHCWLDHTNIIGGIAAWLAGVPRIILSTRNVNPTHFPYIFKDWYQEWYQRLATSPRVRLVANSLEGAKSYAEWMKVPLDRFSIIHNGIDLTVIGDVDSSKAATLRAEEKISPTAPVIGGVFRLSGEKQPKTFLAVVAEVRTTLPKVKALIAGIGPMEDEIKREIIRLGLQDTVRLLGRRSDIPVVMTAADVILLTSSEEGFPNVLMEAQTFGRPVVCTAAGGIPEAVNHGKSGYVCKIGDITSLSSAVTELLINHDLRKKMGREAQSWVRENFSCERLVEKTIQSYDLSSDELNAMKTGAPFVPPVEQSLSEIGTPPSGSENTAELWTSANPFERKFQEAIDFDLRNAKSQMNFLPGGRSYAKGRTCMEIGPGQDIGIPLIIMGFGAKAYVIDK
jgi:glycosyltransferase involved in cell wall biosynthesis